VLVSVVYKKIKILLHLIGDVIQCPSVGSPSKLIPDLQQLLLNEITFLSVNLETTPSPPPLFSLVE